MYAKMEEDHGQTRQAMQIYERAVDKVLPEDKYEVSGLVMLRLPPITSLRPLNSRQMFNMYIRRAAELIGLTRTRPIYEKALEELGNEQAM